ncbi:MAG: hypothetical protein MUE95_11745 [Cyclobacteriaceae bacterium]|nr:hypothetical protein [Cyclobacteriaceae bacterium]
MAKATAKKTTESVTKKAEAPVKKSAPKKTAKAGVSIDQACESALDKLKNLSIEPQLQSDIEWCLGSYRFDGNPVGLFQNGARALEVLAAARAKSAKAVPAKLITDLQKALQ